METPYEEQGHVEPIDLRLYVGMVFFRWKIIAVCFLYCLLGGVVYIQLAPQEYTASAVVFVDRDRDITVTGAGEWWAQPATHAQFLSDGRLADRVVLQLVDEWAGRMGGRGNMRLGVSAWPRGSEVIASTRSRNREYAVAFLNALIDLHSAEWQVRQSAAMGASREKIEKELALTEEKIEAAQNDVIEYRRINDIMRQSVRSNVEEGFIRGVVNRRAQLETQLFMIETQNPEIKTANAAVVNQVDAMTRAVLEAASGAPSAGKPADGADAAGGGGEADWIAKALAETEAPSADEPPAAGSAADGPAASGTPPKPRDIPADLRVRLIRLEQQRTKMAADLTPEHPRIRELDRQIADIHGQLAVQAQLARARLQDTHKSMLTLLKSLEAVEYRWQAKELQSMLRQAELDKLRSRVSRYEQNYATLYQRLHELQIADETKTERFSVRQRAWAGTKPAWPNPGRILLVALVAGLASGMGLAVALQFLDNKIQTIKDVEKGLRIPFLGGVPFWVHSGLEKAIRPIVTEEHSSGAIEAYRALRTSVTGALARMNEKTVFVTSADSREGKTLTTLNLAIITAQTGKRVLLVDMDLRRGRLHRSLGVEKEPGVTDALRDGVSFKPVIAGTRVENLDLIPSGGTIGDSAELLQSSNVAAMLVDLQDDYDYIFVDTSPVLRVTDTVILATQGVGAVVYVARVNHTPKPLVRYSLQMLKDARVLGLIMNSIEMHRISSLYYAYQYPNYAYYSNAYAYGYNYYDYGEQSGRRRRRRPSAGGDSVAARLRRLFMPSG